METRIFVEPVPTQMLGFRPDRSYGMITVLVPGHVSRQVSVPYNTYVVAGTTNVWNDSLTSNHNGVTYFPANVNLGGVQATVSGVMTGYLTKGRAAGTHDINMGGYQIRVAWQPDSSDDPDNEGFTINQMYPH
jgi:hypothetical protein